MLSEYQLEEFSKNGYIGPLYGFDARLVSEMKDLINNILNEEKSPTYGHMTHRDWHLSRPQLLQMLLRDNVVSKLKQILGDDIILWRSSIFNKSAGAASLGWHQAHLFAGEEYGNYKPAFYPPLNTNENDHFCLSVWIALDDVTTENGALMFAKGTHVKQHPVKKVPFLDSEFASVFKDFSERTNNPSLLDRFKDRFANETIFDPNADDVDLETLEMKAGEFIIFTDRTLHASLANSTQNNRIGINFRVIVPACKIYPQQYEGDYIDGNDHNIKNHACVMVSGKDSFGFNKYQN